MKKGGWTDDLDVEERRMEGGRKKDKGRREWNME